MKPNSSYFARRSREERATAENATDLVAQDVHLALAIRYEQLADASGKVAAGECEPTAKYVKAWLCW